MKKLPAGALLLFGLVLAASLDLGSAVWAQQGGGSGTNQHRISAMSHPAQPSQPATAGQQDIWWCTFTVGQGTPRAIDYVDDTLIRADSMSTVPLTHAWTAHIRATYSVPASAYGQCAVVSTTAPGGSNRFITQTEAGWKASGHEVVHVNWTYTPQPQAASASATPPPASNPSPAGQSTSGASSPSSVSLTGTWRLAWMSHTAPTTLTLQQDGNRITGTLGTTPIEGTLEGSRIHFTMRDFQGVVHDYTGELDSPGVLSGDETAPQEDISWRATRPVAASTAAPAAHPATAAAASVAHPAPAPVNPGPAAAAAPAVVAPAGKGYRCVFDLHQGTQSIRYSAGPIVTEASQAALSEAWKNFIMATYHPSGKVQHAGCPVLQGRPENWDRAVSAWEANSNQLGVPTTHVNWTSAPKK